MRTETEIKSAVGILASAPEEIAARALKECEKAGRDTEYVRALFVLADLIRERRAAEDGKSRI